MSSLTLGMGQFCTKPGLLVVPTGYDRPRRVSDALAAQELTGWLLTSAIAGAYAGVQRLLDHGATVLRRGRAATAGWAVAPVLLSVDPALLQPGSPLVAECFGPAGLVCEYNDDTELAGILDALPGSLAAAVQSGSDDHQVAGVVARLAAHADGWSSTAGPPASRSTGPSSTAAPGRPRPCPPRRRSAPPRCTDSSAPSPTKTSPTSPCRHPCNTPIPRLSRDGSTACVPHDRVARRAPHLPVCWLRISAACSPGRWPP